MLRAGALIAGLLVACVAAQASSLTREVDRVFAPVIGQDAPGYAVAVIHQGRMVYERGYGMADLEHRVAVTPRTVFSVASISKQFTAAAIALLQEAGRLSTSDDVRKYVPEIPDYGVRISIDQLIHHTSGLRDCRNLVELSGHDSDARLTARELLALLARQRALNFAPGTQYSYSNTNYDLLEIIVARITGVSLREFAARNMFQPLAMNSTRFEDDATQIVPDRAVGYFRRSEGGMGRTVVAGGPNSLVGDAGLLTTIEDLARWDDNFYHNRLGKGGRELIEQLMTPSRLADGTAVAYGWGLDVTRYRGLRVVSHSGGSNGFTANMMRFPDQRLSVVVLSNASGAGSPALSRRVAGIYLAGQLGPEEPPEVEPPAPPAALAAPLSAYVGAFHSDELDSTFVVQVDHQKLVVSVGDAPLRVLKSSAVDEFTDVNQSPFTTYRFTRDGRSEVTGLIVDQHRARNLGFWRLR